MTAWIATQSDWLRVERLPGYAHDINPIEIVWGNVKTVELANLCPDTIDQAHAAAEPDCSASAPATICASPSSPNGSGRPGADDDDVVAGVGMAVSWHRFVHEFSGGCRRGCRSCRGAR